MLHRSRTVNYASSRRNHRPGHIQLTVNLLFYLQKAFRSLLFNNFLQQLSRFFLNYNIHIYKRITQPLCQQYARLRISAQQPDEYYRGKCDCELNNAADTAAAFEMEAREFFQRLIDTIKEEKAHGKQGI